MRSHLSRLHVPSLLIASLFTLAACSKEPPKDVPTAAGTAGAAARAYACPMGCEKGKTYAEKGKCPICEMELQESVDGKFAHTDHSPKHGGQLIMAQDDWHHVEGTLPDLRSFTLWTFDQFTEPLAVGRTTGTLTVTVKPRKGSTPAEHVDVALQPGPTGTALVAALPDGLSLPVTTRAIVTFEGKEPFTFDFQFKELSVEPPPGSVAAHRHAHEAAPHGEADARPVPTDRPGILATLSDAAAQARKDVDAGRLAEMHGSADRIGKLAAALAKAGGREGRLAKLATDLDAQGDAGNAAGVLEVLGEIAKDLEAARR